MNYEIVICEGKQYKRVTKKTAKQFYDQGQKVLLLPVNIRFENPWISPFELKKNGYSFNNEINKYEFYNCNNTEVGNYAKYYILDFTTKTNKKSIFGKFFK